MRVLVLGGTRFIGLHAVKLLAERGHAVGVFHRGQTHAALPAGVTELLGDRARLGESRNAIRGFAPDAVVDMFAMTEAHARALVDVLGGVARRFVVASSCDVYRARDRVWRVQPGPPDPVPLDEGAPLRETRFPYRAEAKGEDDVLYDYDKIPVEEIVVRELSAKVLRLPAVYGPGDYRRRVWEYLKPMLDGRERIVIDAEHAAWRWTRGFVSDMAHAIALAVVEESGGNRAAGRIYNVGEPDALTERQWAESVGRAAGWTGRMVALSRASLPPAMARDAAKLDFTHHWVTSTERIRDELGYRELGSRDEALRTTVAWERAHPPSAELMPKRDYAAEDAALG